MYTQYQDDVNQNFKFTPYFESLHLAELLKTNSQTFSLVKCLSLNFKNSSIKAIYYEVNNDSTTDCKLYSPPIIKYSDLMTTSAPVKLYLSNDMTIMPTGDTIF